MAIMLAHRSPMSPVVRHKLPVRGPHSHGWFEPHSQILKTIGRRALARASRNLAYWVGASSPSELHQSSMPSSAMPSPKRSEEHTSELQSQSNLVCRLLLEKKKKKLTHTR